MKINKIVYIKNQRWSIINLQAELRNTQWSKFVHFSEVLTIFPVKYTIKFQNENHHCALFKSVPFNN